LRSWVDVYLPTGHHFPAGAQRNSADRLRLHGLPRLGDCLYGYPVGWLIFAIVCATLIAGYVVIHGVAFRTCPRPVDITAGIADVT
jgi:hypothetical protein